MTTIRNTISDTSKILVNGLKVFFKIWPLLLLVAIAGIGCHNAGLWLAFTLGRINIWLAYVTLPLITLPLLIAYMLMFHIIGQYLPGFKNEGDPDIELYAGLQGNLQNLGKIFRSGLGPISAAAIPFVIAYYYQGELTEDLFTYVNLSFADQWINPSLSNYDMSDRLSPSGGVVVIGVALLLLAVHKFLERIELMERSLVWTWFSAYLEVLWLTVAGILLHLASAPLSDWINSRVIVVETINKYQVFLSSFKNNEWFAYLYNMVIQLVSAAIQSVIVPFSWLIIGAIILALPGIKARESFVKYAKGTKQLFEKLPILVRLAAGERITETRNRFGGIFSAIKLLTRARLSHVLAGYLVLSAALALNPLIKLGIVRVLAPLSVDRLLAFSGYINLASLAISSSVLIALAAATIEQITVEAKEASADQIPQKFFAEEPTDYSPPTNSAEIPPEGSAFYGQLSGVQDDTPASHKPYAPPENSP